ncbi:MAG: thioredoxin [Chloroflexi bacterium RBG_16_57_8]|nr:MAG: thioredoxin [Chloroflexi bacterium RBG_16_57_8]
MTVTVYPTGTTIYEPQKCWNGFTILSTPMGKDAYLIDMNGNVVKCWKGFGGFPNKVFPGGYLLGSTGVRNRKYSFQDQLDLVQVDWDGNVVWKFDQHEYISDPEEQPRWMARQHHDYQRDGNPVGYYVPKMEPRVDGGNTLVLCHKNVRNAAISDRLLLDDAVIEVTWEGKTVWEWKVSDHFEELGFSRQAKKVLARDPNVVGAGEGFGDWMHINSISKLGPNRWFDRGDKRFHPDNLVWSSRQANILAVIDKETGKLVWRIGPDYDLGSELHVGADNTGKTSSAMGYIIGPHHAHIIPRGLPGEGNLILFDNGGWAGYGVSHPGSKNGLNNALRDYSRVIELDPVSLDIVWQYSPKEAGFVVPMAGNKFYSSIVSSAQRLANGNTLITEGVDGRVFEVTKEHEIVWEYVNPRFESYGAGGKVNLVYRAYRLPYEWVPQAPKPRQKAIHRPDNTQLRVPQSGRARAVKAAETAVETGGESQAQFCVVPVDER